MRAQLSRKNLQERLPPITTALVLESIELEVFRDQFGMVACTTRGAGAMRRKLGPIPGEPPCGMPAELARDGARILLAALCQQCPHKRCKMKGWDNFIA